MTIINRFIVSLAYKSSVNLNGLFLCVGDIDAALDTGTCKLYHYKLFNFFIFTIIIFCSSFLYGDLAFRLVFLVKNQGLRGIHSAKFV